MGSRLIGRGTETNIKTCEVERWHTCVAMPRTTQRHTGKKQTNCRTKQRPHTGIGFALFQESWPLGLRRLSMHVFVAPCCWLVLRRVARVLQYRTQETYELHGGINKPTTQWRETTTKCQRATVVDNETKVFMVVASGSNTWSLAPRGYLRWLKDG